MIFGRMQAYDMMRKKTSVLELQTKDTALCASLWRVEENFPAIRRIGTLQGWPGIWGRERGRETLSYSL